MLRTLFRSVSVLLTSLSLASVFGACDGYRRLLSRASVALLQNQKAPRRGFRDNSCLLLNGRGSCSGLPKPMTFSASKPLLGDPCEAFCSGRRRLRTVFRRPFEYPLPTLTRVRSQKIRIEVDHLACFGLFYAKVVLLIVFGSF